MATPRTRPRRVPSSRQRPALYLGLAASGAVLAHVLVGAAPAEQADAAPVSVATQLGLTAQTAQAAPDLDQLGDLAASRNSRDAAQTAAAQSQADADQAVLDQQAAEAAAAEAAAAEAAAEAAAAEAAAEEEAAVAASIPAVAGIADITNNYGPVSARVQAAADAVVTNVPGADAIHLGGTRASAADPHGHPSGNALDFMVMTDAALGDDIVAYHIAHWSDLGVDYLIWEQRMLSSPGGSWVTMENRGSATANHFDHVHVNYRG